MTSDPTSDSPEGSGSPGSSDPAGSAETPGTSRTPGAPDPDACLGSPGGIGVPDPSLGPADRPFDTGVRPEDLLPGARPVPVRTPWGEYALYATDRGVLCAGMFCPHLDGPLWEGTLSGTEITCPWHRWTYDLASGRCTHVPGGVPDASTIARLTVRLTVHGTYVVGPPP